MRQHKASISAIDASTWQLFRQEPNGLTSRSPKRSGRPTLCSFCQVKRSPKCKKCHTIYEKLRSCYTESGSPTSTHIDGTEKLSAKERPTVTFAPTHRPLDKLAQTRSCPDTSSHGSSNKHVNVDHTVATVSCELATNDEGLLEYSLPKHESLRNMADLQDENRDKTNIRSFEDCLALLSFIQKWNHRVLITIGAIARAKITVACLLDTGAGQNFHL